MIRFNNLTLGYGTRTLIDSLTGEVRCGELTALVGRNGTGKSTLLRAIAQLGEIHSGDIFLNGKPIGDISPAELSTLVAFVTTDKVRIANHSSVVCQNGNTLIGKIWHILRHSLRPNLNRRGQIVLCLRLARNR